MSAAKDYLRRLKHLDDEIESQLELIERLKAKAERCTSIIKDDPFMGFGGSGSKTAVIDKRIDIENKLSIKVVNLYNMIDEAEAVISKLAKAEHRTVLRNYYLNNKTWPLVAQAMYCSERTAKNLHGEALLEISKYIGFI